MKKTVETSFKRIETKYVVNKEDLDDLLKDLKKYVVEEIKGCRRNWSWSRTPPLLPAS